MDKRRVDCAINSDRSVERVLWLWYTCRIHPQILVGILSIGTGVNDVGGDSSHNFSWSV